MCIVRVAADEVIGCMHVSVHLGYNGLLARFDCSFPRWIDRSAKEMVSLLLDYDLRILPSIHLLLQSIWVTLILNCYDRVDDRLLVALEGRSLRFLQKLARSVTLVQNQ